MGSVSAACRPAAGTNPLTGRPTRFYDCPMGKPVTGERQWTVVVPGVADDAKCRTLELCCPRAICTRRGYFGAGRGTAQKRPL